MTAGDTPSTLRPHGSDRVEAGDDGSIWLICALPKGWTPRRGKANTPGEYPGTAVRCGTDLFEVVETIANTDGTVRYRLESWPDRHVVRSIQTYEARTEAAGLQERADRKRSIARRRLATVLSPLLGHLPGPVQEQMEGEFGAPAVAMTVASALPLFALGFVSSLFSLAVAFGQGFSGGMSGLENVQHSIPHLLPVPLAVYLAVESGIRLGVAFLQARPIGSLPGTLLYEVWRNLRGQPMVSPNSLRGLAATPERALLDRFRMLEPLLALLSPGEQELLERRFGMEALRWGRITAFILLAVGGLNALASLATLAAGVGGWIDAIWLLAGAALVAEQVDRLRRIARGHPAGSVLGALVRPLARSLLR